MGAELLIAIATVHCLEVTSVNEGSTLITKSSTRKYYSSSLTEKKSDTEVTGAPSPRLAY